MNVSVCFPYRSDHGGRRDQLWDWTRSQWKQAFPNFEYVLGEHLGPEDFNISLARNRAINIATGDIIIVADTDVLPQWRAIPEAIEAVVKGEWMFAFNRYYCASEDYTERLLSQDKPKVIEDTIEYVDRGTSTQSGCLVISKDALYEVGGFDIEFMAWGPEDVAFALAAETILRRPHGRTDSFAVHLWHPRYNDNWPDNPASVAAHNRIKHYHAAYGDPVAMKELKGEFRC